MIYGYGYVNNHMPTLKATVMRGGSIAPSSLLTGLYAVYKGESNTNDSLGNYNGTPYGGLTYSGGKSGNAFNLNGTTAYVSLPNDSFNFTGNVTGNFSISCWINLNSVSGNQAIFSNLSYLAGVSNGWFLLMRNNKLYFEFYQSNGTYDYLTSNTNLSTSAWYHISVVRVFSQSTKIYINGALDISNSSTYNPSYASGIPIPSAIGAWKYDALTAIMYLNGKIDEVNVWNRELTATEVTTLYNSGTGKFYPTF
jgi:hypothetical protein